MQYIQRDKLVHIEWSIFRGTSQVLEDFSRALVKMFLIGGNEKYLLTATAEGGKLLADLPSDLPEGAYSLEAIWVKNYGNLLPHRQPLTPGGEPVCPRRPGPHPNDPCFIHPHDNRFNDRCLMRSRKDYVFALTDYPSEETVTGESGEVTVRLASSVATYGYDGLSAYQIAVMRGDFSGTEGEFLAQSGFTKLKTINGESLIGEGNIEITGGGTLETATETKLGGIRAATKTSLETQEVKIDPSTGKLYTLPGGEGGVKIVNNPDEEDLHSIEKSTDVHVLQFADKEYNASAFSGLGRVYLRKNISSNKNILTQAMMSKANTRYIIQYDYDLDGETITVPAGCTLDFQGGTLDNGKLVGNNTVISASNNKIFKDALALEKGGWEVDYAKPEWFGCRKNDNSIDSAVYINKALQYFFNVKLDTGTYYISSPIVLGQNFTLSGNGENNTIIKKITATEHKQKNSAIYIERGNYYYSANVIVEKFTLRDDNYSVNYGIYIEGLAQSTFRNLLIYGFKYGIYGTDDPSGWLWNLTFDTVQCNCNTIHDDKNDYGWDAHASYGFFLKPPTNGTSLLFNKCWAHDCAYGYRIDLFDYSTMNSCAADNICGVAYDLRNSQITINGTGCENVYADVNYMGAAYIENCRLVANNFYGWNIFSKKSNASYAIAILKSEVVFNIPNFITTSENKCAVGINIEQNSKVIFSLPKNMPVGTVARQITGNSLFQVINLDKTNMYGDNFNNEDYTGYSNKNNSSLRPSLKSNQAGFVFYDTELKKNILWNGSKWVDTNGFENYDNFFKNSGVIEDDFNNYVKSGCYILSEGTYNNHPNYTYEYGILLVFTPSNAITFQIFIEDIYSRVYIRSYWLDNGWRDWVLINPSTEGAE